MLFITGKGETTNYSHYFSDYSNFILPGSGNIVVGDSLVGSFTTGLKLFMENGLFSIVLVKTAYKQFPRLLLPDTELTQGEWTSCVGEVDSLKVMATRFLDLQEKS